MYAPINPDVVLHDDDNLSGWDDSGARKHFASASIRMKFAIRIRHKKTRIVSGSIRVFIRFG